MYISFWLNINDELLLESDYSILLIRNLDKTTAYVTVYLGSYIDSVMPYLFISIENQIYGAPLDTISYNQDFAVEIILTQYSVSLLINEYQQRFTVSNSENILGTISNGHAFDVFGEICFFDNAIEQSEISMFEIKIMNITIPE